MKYFIVVNSLVLLGYAQQAAVGAPTAPRSTGSTSTDGRGVNAEVQDSDVNPHQIAPLESADSDVTNDKETADGLPIIGWKYETTPPAPVPAVVDNLAENPLGAGSPANTATPVNTSPQGASGPPGGVTPQSSQSGRNTAGPGANGQSRP